MNDRLLRLFSADISVTGAQTQQAGIFAGRNRSYFAVPRIGGDVTGTTPTLSFTLQESNALASGYADIPSMVNINVIEMWGDPEATGGLAAAGAKPELPRVPGTPPKIAFTTTKDYVRAVVTAGGTSPVFPKATIYAEPIEATSKMSGS